MKQKEYKLRRIEIPISILGVGKWNATIFARIISISNDGIGSYECHGFKGYDRGSDYIEEFEAENILLNGKRPDPILYKRVLDLLYSDDNLFAEVGEILMKFEEDELVEEEELV